MAESCEQNRREEVLAKMRKLAEVSKSLEQYARAQSSAFNVMQAKEIKKHVDELTERQDKLVFSIVDMHPDKAVRDDFMALSKKIDDFRPQVRACQNPEELEQIKVAMDAAVDEWVSKFQSIAAFLAGAKKPEE